MYTKRDLSVKIDWKGLWSSLSEHWRLFLYTIPAFLVVGGIYAWSLVDFYTCSIKLAPELNPASRRAVMSIFASVTDLRAISKDGAVNPTVYPNVMLTFDFASRMLPVKVERTEGDVLTYYDYLLNYQRNPWWGTIFKEDKYTKPEPIKEFKLPTSQYIAAAAVLERISCSVDPKSYIITITVKDQDPFIAAQIADSAAMHLQEFITKYKVSKALVEYEYLKTTQQQGKDRYDKAAKAYADFSDANRDIHSQKLLSQQQMLQEEMQLQYETYNNLSEKMIAAEAKVQEAVPAFMKLESPSVPLNPSEPNRLMIVLIAAMTAAILTIFYIWYKEGDLYRLIVGGYKHEKEK